MTYKLTDMQQIIKTTLWVTLVLFLAACGSTTKDDKGALGEKKTELEKLKKDQKEINLKITTLEEEIAKLDPESVRQEKAKLVSLENLDPGGFNHYIDLQGIVDAENIAYVTPRGMGGQVRAIYVKQGEYVQKGKLMIKLEDDLARKQVDQLETQLAFAEDLYKRQQNLWSQNIGTEVQVLNAKNNVDQLKKQISLANEQLSYANVYAQMSGVADQVNIKVGETFTAATASLSGIRIVNTNDLKIKVQVPENYLGRVGVGSTLIVTLPEANNKTITTKVNVAGKIIDPASRSFYIEGKIPTDKDFRPNQIALVRIQDYAAADVITIPVNTLQNDEKGKFVLVAAKEGERMVARKRPIVIGELYGSELEVKSGLQKGDQLIVDGFQGLYDGQPITTTAQ